MKSDENAFTVKRLEVLWRMVDAMKIVRNVDLSSSLKMLATCLYIWANMNVDI